MTNSNFQQLANFIWSVADLLRGPYRPPQYERVMLPLTVLRRFDAVLAPTKDEVLKRYEALKAKNTPNIDAILNNLAKDEDGRSLGFHNHSQLDFYKLKGDPDNIGRHLEDYIQGFSENIRKIFERFEFSKEIEKLEESNRLYQVVAQFAEIDLHPKRVDNITMGLVFEDLIRRFNESANETAGDHFTPREVIQLMVNLLLEPDTDVLTQTSRVFDNADFGHRRITVLRPLRLRFQITEDARERFLNTCPELYDALLAVQDALGSEPLLDWNETWDAVQQVFRTLPDDVEGWAKGAKGTAQKKIFRDCFSVTDPEAAPVIAKRHIKVTLDEEALFPEGVSPLDDDALYALLGLYAAGQGKHVEYEPDPTLKDFENIPLKEDIVSYFQREVQPYVADAWIDRETLDEQDGVSAKSALKSISIACSFSISHRDRWPKSMPNSPRWRSVFCNCCGR